MLRQRIRARRSPFAVFGRLPLLVLSLALVWYGLMVVLLALEVSPQAVNAVSGYRSAYDFLAGLEPADMTGGVRVVAGLGGACSFLLFGYLALKSLSRPYLARSELLLGEAGRGVDVVGPRAVERAVEGAARSHPAIDEASARYGTEDVNVSVHVSDARVAGSALREVRGRGREALAQHELPLLPVNVTLTGFEEPKGRELR
ncbi:MAG: hypothetical protein WKF65_10420 [Gaiellaceae bacterium]